MVIFPSKQQKVNTLYISIFKTTFWILSMWLSHFVCNPQQICSSVYTAILWTTDVTSIGDLRHQRLHAFGFVWHLLAGSSNSYGWTCMRALPKMGFDPDLHPGIFLEGIFITRWFEIGRIRSNL